MLVCHIITGLSVGGAEAALFRLCTASTLHGHRHVVISLMAGGVLSEQFKSRGVVVHSLGLARGALTAAGLLRLLRMVRDIKPDVVQTWMYHADLVGGLVARLGASVPTVWGVRHANLDPDMHSRSTLLVARACALLSRWVPEQIVTCSEAAISVHCAVGYDATKFVVIPNGYELENLVESASLRQRARRALGISEQTFVLGMMARFHPLKGHRALLAELSVLAESGVEFVALFAGAGMSSDNVQLADWIEEANVVRQVRLLGPREDVPAFMNALDLHVLSSVGEGFPNVLAEAMACGVPCVSTDVGDARSIVGDLGWIVPPGQPGELGKGIRAAMDRAVHDPDAWRAQKDLCRLWIESHYSLERMVAAFELVWREASIG